MRRIPEYLSPTQLNMWQSKPEDYYKQYLCPIKHSRPGQLQVMSIGSAFDAYVKSHLFQTILSHKPEYQTDEGKKISAKYDLMTLFTAQVEAENRAWAWVEGKYVFDRYVDSRALADLAIDLNKAIDDPKFEFDLKGVVEGYREGVTKSKQGVVLMGKPDLHYINAGGNHIVRDWKVNGYLSNSPPSPTPGFLECRKQNPTDCRSFFREGPHKSAMPTIFNGTLINGCGYLETYSPEWATQLSTYGWLLGEPVGKEIIVGVDQLVCNRIKTVTDPSGRSRPSIRVVTHMSRVSSDFQFMIMGMYQTLWNLIHEEPFYFFRNLPFDESAAKCRSLDKEVEMFTGISSDDPIAQMVGMDRRVW